MCVTFQIIDFRINVENSTCLKSGGYLYVNTLSGHKEPDKVRPGFQG